MRRIIAVALVANAILLAARVVQDIPVAEGGEGEAVASCNGDTDGNGERNITDAIYLLNWLFSGGPEPVALAQGGGGLTPEQEEILSHLSIVEPGDGVRDHDFVGGKTIRITDANLQIVNGSGRTNVSNRLGNLIVGYNEDRPEADDSRTGSHNVVVGTRHNYVSHSGLVVGEECTIQGPSCAALGLENFAGGGFSGATVVGGQRNVARQTGACISGGVENTVSGVHAAISGGRNNNATARGAAVNGGENNNADGQFSNVSGGRGNEARGDFAAIQGGFGNEAVGDFSAVTGGAANQATGERACAFGGIDNRSQGEGAVTLGGGALSIGGGVGNLALGPLSVACGGRNNTAGDALRPTIAFGVVVGGMQSDAQGFGSTVTGGFRNTADGIGSSVSGGNSNTARGEYSVVSGGERRTARNDFNWVAGSLQEER